MVQPGKWSLFRVAGAASLAIPIYLGGFVRAGRKVGTFRLRRQSGFGEGNALEKWTAKQTASLREGTFEEGLQFVYTSTSGRKCVMSPQVSPSDLQDDFQALVQLCDLINQTNDVPDPTESLLGALILPAVQDLKAGPSRIEVTPNIYVPLPLEVARILRYLRQRFTPDGPAPSLVERIRVEAKQRFRPKFDQPISALSGAMREIAEIGQREAYSEFQIEGWRRVLETLEMALSGQPAATVLTAPTGAGKTEAFLLPLVHYIVSTLSTASVEEPHIVFVYPRVALLQDQVKRIFRYVDTAVHQQNLPEEQWPIIGLQFHGIRRKVKDTLQTEFFRDTPRGEEFTLFDRCPWCGANEALLYGQEKVGRNVRSVLHCQKCGHKVYVSLSKEEHESLSPHILVTTAESLDYMYMDWNFAEYLPQVQALVLDEAHLFHQLYGAHIHHLIQRLRDIVRGSGRELSLIAASATIPDARDFAERLFFGTEKSNAVVYAVDASDFGGDLAGLEIFYFLQAPKRKSLSTLIQAAMAVGHAVLPEPERLLIFANSLDIVGRLGVQLRDAELSRQLWKMRIEHSAPNLFQFLNHSCPQKTPYACDIYLAGECWRGILGGIQCTRQQLPGLRTMPLDVQLISGKTKGERRLRAPIVIGTSALEVGIDDPHVQATLHYRPPRTVFDFIQRRGRAGREFGRISHTVVVLGQESTDFFYLVRRHRLIAGDYTLPLNPENPVVKRIHDQLRDAREMLLRQAITTQNKHGGLWLWVLDRLFECPYVTQKYQQDLINIKQRFPASKWFHGWNALRKWIERGKKDAEPSINVEWALFKLIHEIVDPQLAGIAEKVYESFRQWLNEDIDDNEMKAIIEENSEQVADIFKKIGTGRSSMHADEAAKVIQILKQMSDFIQRERNQARKRIQEGRAWYDFFTTLERIYDQDYVRYLPAEVVRRVYQAFFFLHEGLGHHGCAADIQDHIPDVFFQTVHPVHVEAITTAGETIREPEEVRFITSLFIPYRLSYRYTGDGLFGLKTFFKKKSPRTSSGLDKIVLRPDAEGPRLKDPNGYSVVDVRTLRLQEIISDSSQQIGLCNKCYTIYDHRRSGTTCRCGGTIESGSLYVTKAYVDSWTIPDSGSVIRIGNTFELLKSIEASTTLRGATVSFRPEHGDQVKFQAFLEPGLYYRMLSRGVRWRVPNLPQNGTERKRWLDTAAVVLLKTMAAVVGVREDALRYEIDYANGTVIVWEQFEGGAGLSEVFVETLQKDPEQIYREMVTTVACPVYLAEQLGTLWRDRRNGKDLVDYLENMFGLSPGHPTIRSIANEALAETRYSDPEGRVCSKYDGCPVCVQTLVASAESEPSRTVGWELVRSLVHRVAKRDLGAFLARTPGPILRVEGDEYDVLVL